MSYVPSRRDARAPGSDRFPRLATMVGLQSGIYYSWHALFKDNQVPHMDSIYNTIYELVLYLIYVLLLNRTGLCR